MKTYNITLITAFAVAAAFGGTDVTTDGSGDATVQMSLAGSANFVRAQ